MFGFYRDMPSENRDMPSENCHQDDIFPGKQDNARPHSAHATTEWFLDTLHQKGCACLFTAVQMENI